MAEKIVFDTEVNVSGGQKTVGDLRKEFRDLNAQINNAKVGTDDYNKALRRLGEVKGELTDLQGNIQALDPERKVQVFNQLTNTISTGFTGAISLMASFGIQSEGLQQVLLRIQAVMMFTQAIQSMGELVKVWKVFNLVVAANPLMLAAAAIGAIAVALLASRDSAKSATISQSEYNIELLKTKKIKEDLYQKELKDETTFIKESLAQISASFEQKKKLAQINGEDVNKIELDLLRSQQEGLNQLREQGRLQSQASLNAAINEAIAIEEKKNNLLEIMSAEKSAKDKERDLEIKEDLEKTRDEYLMNLKKHGEVKVFTEQEINDALLSERDRHDAEDEKSAENFDARARAREDKANADFKKAADDKVRIAQHREQAIRLFATTTSDVILRLMQSESDSMAKKLDAKAKMLRAQGKNEQEINKILQADQKRKAGYDKKIALFQIGVSTAQAIAGLVKAVYTKDPDPTGISQAAIVAANTIIILGNIIAAKKLLTAVPDEGGGGGELPSLDLGGAGGGGGGSSAGGGGGAAPIDINKPLLSTTTGTGTIVNEQGQFVGFAGQGQAQGQQQSTQEQLNALQVYVVESDIKNVFKKVDLIEQKAKF